MKENNASESDISVAVVKSSVFVACDRSGGSNVVEIRQKEARKKGGRSESWQKKKQS
jgi:hypothetical protein